MGSEMCIRDREDGSNPTQKAVQSGLESLANKQNPGAFADPEETALRVQTAMAALVAAAPTKIRRALGYLEDEQAQAMNKYRQSAQTVRSVDNRKPVPSSSAPLGQSDK